MELGVFEVDLDDALLMMLASAMLVPAAPAAAPSALRVRQILDGVGPAGCRSLKKHLPVDAPAMPVNDTARYPNALLQFLPKPNQYSYLGLIAEDMLMRPVAEITPPTLLALLPRYHPTATPAEINKVRVSKTTQPFLDLLVATRTQMDAILGGAALRGQSVLTHDKVIGHPDARTDTIIFEMKLTGQLIKNWSYFQLQAMAYAALDPAVTTVCIVLPLQATIWRCDVTAWANRLKYRDALNAAATKLLAPAAPLPAAAPAVAVGGAGAAAPLAPAYNPYRARELCETYRIGHHAPKLPTLMKTVGEFPDPRKPYQIFLGGPQSSKMSITDGELAATAAMIGAADLRVYVHSQYIINLSNASAPDDWNVTLLARNLQYASAIGSRGVVVHVGKATDKPYATALENMRANITRLLEFATPQCPLLLETPAGQGTETLKGEDEFIAFAESFADPRLRVCLDTCHVFACGHKPLQFIDKLAAKPDLLQLIHFNDSMEACGSCKDRHAPIGAGRIGYDGMTAIAERCHHLGLPMVIE
jgi:deoxyribonuclease-4